MNPKYFKRFQKFKVSRLWGRFWPNKWTFVKELWTKKSWQIKLQFTSKNPFEISILQSKVTDKNQKEVEMDIYFNIFIQPLRFLSLTFYWRIEISNGFLEVKSSLIFQLFFVQSLKKNVHLLGQNRLQSLLTLNKWTFWCLLKTADFGGDFGLVNERF